MIQISFKASFLRQLNKLEKALAEEALEKIEILKDRENHKKLKVHKLHGGFSGCFSFSVNYRTRIIFEYLSDKEIALLYIGDHDLYE